MSTTQIRLVSAGLFFLFIFLSGFWLSNSGKPLNVWIMTIHKLISLGALVFLAVTVYQVNQVARLTQLEITAGIVTGVLFICAIATGGLLSTAKQMPTLVLKFHQVAPYLIVVSTAVTLYLLLVLSRELPKT
jgi:hypothetical protein